MPILKNIVTPNGMPVAFHKAKSASVDYASSTAIVQVASWATAQDHDVGKGLAWMWPVQISLASLANIDAALAGADVFTGGSVVPDESGTLAAEQARKKAALDAERERRNTLPIAYAGASFDADERGQRNVQAWQTQLAAGATLPSGFVWRDAANVDHPADAAFVNGLGASITLRGTQLYAQGWALKAQVDAATTIAEVQAVAWPA